MKNIKPGVPFQNLKEHGKYIFVVDESRGSSNSKVNVSKIQITERISCNEVIAILTDIHMPFPFCIFLDQYIDTHKGYRTCKERYTCYYRI
jgi:hypothetical protein